MSTDKKTRESTISLIRCVVELESNNSTWTRLSFEANKWNFVKFTFSLTRFILVCRFSAICQSFNSMMLPFDWRSQRFVLVFVFSRSTVESQRQFVPAKVHGRSSTLRRNRKKTSFVRFVKIFRSIELRFFRFHRDRDQQGFHQHCSTEWSRFSGQTVGNVASASRSTSWIVSLRSSNCSLIVDFHRRLRTTDQRDQRQRRRSDKKLQRTRRVETQSVVDTELLRPGWFDERCSIDIGSLNLFVVQVNESTSLIISQESMENFDPTVVTNNRELQLGFETNWIKEPTFDLVCLCSKLHHRCHSTRQENFLRANVVENLSR